MMRVIEALIGAWAVLGIALIFRWLLTSKRSEKR